MRNKNKVLLGAVITIAACGSVIAGSTYALFTSESKTNIAVTAGTVDVTTVVSDVKTYSGVWETDAYKSVETATKGTFTNGGKATIKDGDITLENMSPMDKVTFKVTTKNNSTIDAQYRTRIMCGEDTGLYNGLKVTIGENVFEGITSFSDWTLINPGSTDSIVDVTVELPQEAGNEYQGKKATVSIITEAVQGNAKVSNVDETEEVSLYTGADLRKFASNVNEGSTFYKNKTIKFEGDMDLGAYDFVGINGWNGILNGATIDGNGHTIKNMTIKGGESAGFITSNASKIAIKDLTFDHAYVESDKGNQKYAGVVMGKNYSTSSIENVTITNSEVRCEWQCGGFVGFAEENVPTFKKLTIKDSFLGGPNATAGTVFGLGKVNVALEECVATNVKLYTDSLTWSSTAKADNKFFVGHLYGKTATYTDCTETSVTIVSSY